MCGIAGIVAPEGRRPEREALVAMGDALAHRGPDDATVAVWGRAGLSFRRLSIVDVDGGAQPIDDCSGARHVILNGEIYNHRELRADLESRGHRMGSGSDVEVVVHGYEEWGEAIVAKLRGMFALALWDETQQRLLLARDRLGQKPLVYNEGADQISFASELRALLDSGSIEPNADPVAIHHYLSYQYVPAPLTAFAGVRKLPPGHLMVWEKGRSRIERYWALSFAPAPVIDAPTAAVEVRRLLRDAVQARLMSDVPLGAFLSGGIDSSSVVALMAEFGRVKTFSVGFEEEEFSELSYARLVAEKYDTEHHEFIVRPNAAEALPRLVEHYGEPFADSSALPTYYLSKVTSEHVKVALNGDAGDEVFGGYDRYRLMPLFSALSLLPGVPAVANAVAGPLAAWLPPRVVRLLEAVAPRPEEAYFRVISYFTEEQKRNLYTTEASERVLRADSRDLLLAEYERCDAPDLVGRTQGVDTHTYLPGDLLAKVDIATMACSLEGRSPFLDHALVEFAARLPTHLKVGVGGGKRVLRRAIGDLLPPSILARRKKGFGVPIAKWFRGELSEMLHETLLAADSRCAAFLRKTEIERLVGEHRGAVRDHGNRLWALLMLELWLRRFAVRF